GLELAEDLAEPVVHVARAVDQLLPDREDERVELPDRRFAELGRRVANEVLPELARRLLDLGWGLQPHQRFLEALRLKRPGERLLDYEDDSLAALQQHSADADAVVRRP